jgi:hypothetical protein
MNANGLRKPPHHSGAQRRVTSTQTAILPPHPNSITTRKHEQCAIAIHDAVPLLKRQREDVDLEAKRVRASSALLRQLADVQQESAALQQDNAALRQENAAMQRKVNYLHTEVVYARKDANDKTEECSRYAQLLCRQEAETRRAREEAEAMSECCICSYGMRNGTSTSPVAVDPCGHVFCAQCAQRLDNCPLCRGPMVIKYSIVLPFA